MLLTFSFLN